MHVGGLGQRQPCRSGNFGPSFHPLELGPTFGESNSTTPLTIPLGSPIACPQNPQIDFQPPRQVVMFQAWIGR
jgi:hypothetical protein